jgi:hypothetical protein
MTIPARPAWGDSFAQKDFDQLVAEAEQIFVGTVAATQSRKLETGAIVTDVTFLSPQPLKGSKVSGDIVFRLLGGSVDGETLKPAGFPEFQPGATYVVFCKGNGTRIFPVVGGNQGLFQVKKDSTTGQDLVFDAYGMPITSQPLTEAVSAAPRAEGGPLPTQSLVTLDRFLRAITDRMGP